MALTFFSNVLIDLVNYAKDHLTRNWSDVAKKMTDSGKII